MARCQVRRSLRNRLFRAVLPFARALFAVQDVIYRLLGLDHSWLITTPPSVPVSEAAPYAPTHGYFPDRHGDSLFYRAWPPEGSEAARAVVIAFDGLGSHSRQLHPLGPALARRARLPTLILQAACDRVSDPEAATSLLGCLATGDKELVYFPGAAHGLFYDQDTPEVLRVIADWLERHYSRWQSPAQPGPNCGQQPAA